MDVEAEIGLIGVVIGWLIAILSISIVGWFFDITYLFIWWILGTSAGIISVLVIVVYLVSFFRNFEIVRREN